MAEDLPIGEFITKLTHELNIQHTNKLRGFELELIALIRNCQFLYDNDLPDFKDAKKKSEAWEAIAKVFNVSVGEVQHRWKLLRKSYTETRSKLKNDNASNESTGVSNFPFFDDLKFLEPFIRYRNRYSMLKAVSSEGGVDVNSQSLQKLIKMVKLFPVLYDSNYKGPVYADRKKDGWEKIGKVLGWDIQDCMLKWKSLRERYARERRAKEINGETIKWEFYNDLLFLDDHIKRRNSYCWANRKRENLDKTTYNNYINSSQSSNSDLMLKEIEENEIEFLDIANGFSPAQTPESNNQEDVLDSLSFNSKNIDRLIDNENDTNSDLLLSNQNKKNTTTSSITDEDELFGQAIAAELKNISNVKKKMKIKAEIYKLLYEICD